MSVLEFRRYVKFPYFFLESSLLKYYLLGETSPELFNHHLNSFTVYGTSFMFCVCHGFIVTVFLLVFRGGKTFIQLFFI